MLNRSEQHQYSATSPVGQDNRDESVTKNVSERTRRSAFKDSKIIEKMRAFRVPADLARLESLVTPSTPPSIAPSTSQHPKPVNDNLIPLWADTGDIVKSVAATGALQISEKPAHAFTFNLTKSAREKALKHPAGFLDSLKRPFDQLLRRAGIDLPYWFCIDTDRDGRLHIHGAFGASPEDHQHLKDIMWQAWGKWPGAGLQFQIKINPCDDGWATYSMRNRRRVAKIIGDRTFTITRPLQRDAEFVYTEVRRIMREANDNQPQQPLPVETEAPLEPNQPADKLDGIEIPEEGSAYSKEFLDDLLAGLDDAGP